MRASTLFGDGAEMEPLYDDADAGASQMDANGHDSSVNAVVVPLG